MRFLHKIKKILPYLIPVPRYGTYFVIGFQNLLAALALKFFLLLLHRVEKDSRPPSHPTLAEFARVPVPT